MPAHVRCSELAMAVLRQACHAAWPREACGLLAGHRDGHQVAVARFVALPNVAPGCITFAVAPHAFAAAAAVVPASGLELLGFAHSHPDGCATPSAADLRQLWPHCVQLIAAITEAGTMTTGAFWLHAGAAVPLPLTVPPSGSAPMPGSRAR
ncbi:MAG TPA: Mov34/MPN/PAD-1 family protein [Planctomycetota bacterium]|nr:Mov34/MPN/PAD-1 family protein [Planctomycetota bacterium]